MDIKQEYKKRRKNQFIIIGPIMIVMVPLIMAKEGSEYIWGIPLSYFGAIGLVTIVSALLFSFKNWRCPACNKYLGKGINHNYCPNCGVQLQ